VAGMGRAAIQAREPVLDAFVRQRSVDSQDVCRLSGDCTREDLAPVSGKAFFTLSSPSQQKQRRQPPIVYIANTLATQHLFCAGSTVIARPLQSKSGEAGLWFVRRASGRGFVFFFFVAVAVAAEAEAREEEDRSVSIGRRLGDKRHGRRGSPTILRVGLQFSPSSSRR
jgi:hypothetical protein